MEKKIAILFLFILGILFSLNFVLSFTIQSVSPNYLNRTAPTIINITINNTDLKNITQISFTLPMESIFYGNNATSASASIFTNTTTPPNLPILTWTNTTTDALISPNQTVSFLFNATLRNLGLMFTNITPITAVHLSGPQTQSSYNFVVNFGFSGFVLNETGGNESNVNLTIYQYAVGQNGPPTEIFESSVLTNANGSFSFSSVNGSASLYTLKMIRYGPGIGCYSANVSCNATKVGSILPAFPAMMYYPATANLAWVMEFMRPPSLNGTSFYLEPATTLRLYATGFNGSVTTQQKFGYEVVDQKVGFPVESNIMNSVTTKDIVVPASRNYTIMFTRLPFGSNAFTWGSSCNGSFMNDTNCPTPPISNNSLGTLTSGQILLINQSLVTSQYRLAGCIKIAGINNTQLNITSFILKMVPWIGFVLPIKSDMGDIDITNSNQLDYRVANTPVKCTGGMAYYNVSVIGSSGGINYLIQVFAKNASNEAGNPGLNALSLAGFQNVSITGDTLLNISLFNLAGNYTTNQAEANTTKIKINIQNSTGGAITTNLNANVRIKNTVTGTITYIIESMSSGSFFIPILNNSNWAKVMVFASDSPPREITINLSNYETNVTMVSMNEGTGVGMKRINESGQMEMINSTRLNSTSQIQLRFLRNSVDCNVLTPPANCLLTSMQAKNFNPLTALVAGKINMEMKITSTNVSLMFMNFDMFAAKQPPMESIMNENSSSSSNATSQLWEFGSFAPADTYDYVIVGMPYSDSVINDALDINLSSPLLYDENWKVVWNKSRGDTAQNLTDEFSDYNSTSLYQGFLNQGGLNCSKVDSNLNVTPCYVNRSSNLLYMRVPHFSGVSPNLLTPIISASASTTTSSTGGSVGTASFWTSTQIISDAQFKEGYTGELSKKNRIKLNIGTETHYVGIIDILSNEVVINISSDPIQIRLSSGEEDRVDVDTDGYYDLYLKLNSISDNKANVTIKSIYELAPEGQVTDSGQKVKTEGEESKGEDNKTFWIVIVVVIILILIGVSYSLTNFKKRRYSIYGY